MKYFFVCGKQRDMVGLIGYNAVAHEHVQKMNILNYLIFWLIKIYYCLKLTLLQKMAFP